MRPARLYKSAKDGIWVRDLWIDGLVILSEIYPYGKERTEATPLQGEDRFAEMIISAGPEEAMKAQVDQLYLDGWRSLEEAMELQQQDWAPPSSVPVTRDREVDLSEYIQYCFRCGSPVVHHPYQPTDDPTEMPVIWSCPDCHIKVTQMAISWEE